MGNIKYTELTCKGYNTENCKGIVVSKKYCLCNNCYSKYYYYNIMTEEQKTKRKIVKIRKYRETKESIYKLALNLYYENNL
jgi:hypothetical protein